MRSVITGAPDWPNFPSTRSHVTLLRRTTRCLQNAQLLPCCSCSYCCLAKERTADAAHRDFPMQLPMKLSARSRINRPSNLT